MPVIRVENGENMVERVMAWRSIGELEESSEPGFFGFSVSGNVHKGVCAADDSKDADNDDISEAM